MKTFERTECAYTLIEILVTLSIIGILFTIGYVGFRDFSRREALSGAVKSIQGDLMLTQQYALAGQKPTDSRCTGVNSLIGYNFNVTSTSTYQIEAVCTGGTISPATKVTSLTNALIAISRNPILFKVLGSGTDIPSNQNTLITVTQGGTGKSATITIDSGGGIQ